MEILDSSIKSLFLKLKYNGQLLSTATGFIVQTRKGPALITNRHNFTGRNQNTEEPLSKTGGIPNEVEIVHNSKEGVGLCINKLENILNKDEEPIWYEHPTLKEKADLVALILTNTDGVKVYPYIINNTDPDMLLGPSDSVSVIGFPFGIQVGEKMAIWANGFLATEPEHDYNDLPQFLIDCRSREGQSGSPVVAFSNGGPVLMNDGITHNLKGPISKFLGIYSGRIHKESDLGVVWKASAINELVNSIRLTKY